MAQNTKNRCKDVLLGYLRILEIEDITSDTTENRILPLIFMGVLSAVCDEEDLTVTERNEVMASCLSVLLGQEIEVTRGYVEQANERISSDSNSMQAVAFCQGKNSYSDFLEGDEFAVYDMVTSTIDYIESKYL